MPLSVFHSISVHSREKHLPFGVVNLLSHYLLGLVSAENSYDDLVRLPLDVIYFLSLALLLMFDNVTIA